MGPRLTDLSALTANENVRPTRETHQRKIDHLRSCTSLGLADLPSAKALVDAADFGGTLDPPLFRNVTHLSIGADLIWDLTDSESGPSSILYRLRETISPKHACVHYTIKPRQPWIKAYLSGALGISPCRAGENVDEDELDTLWEMRVVRSTTGCIESLVYSWNLESLTCHETGTETLPATMIPLQRFFSREDVLDEEVAVPHEWVCMERRAREVADATVLVGPPVDNHFEFVDFGCRTCGRDCVNPDQQAGAELSSPSEVSIEKGRSRRNVAKATFAAKAIQAVWDQFPQMGMKEIIEPYLSFTSREQAQPCICCGKK